MKIIVLSGYLILLSIFFGGTSFGSQREIDSDVYLLENQLRDRLTQRLQIAFDKKLKFAIGLEVRTSKVEKPQDKSKDPNQNNNSEKSKEDSYLQTFEGGYLPGSFLVDLRNENNQNPQQRNIASIESVKNQPDRLRVKLVNIGVYVYEKVEQPVIIFIKEQIKKELGTLPSRISIIVKPSPIIKAPEKKVEPPPKSWKQTAEDSLRGNMAEFSKSLAILLFAMFVGLGLLVFSMTFRKVLSNLSQSLNGVLNGRLEIAQKEMEAKTTSVEKEQSQGLATIEETVLNEKMDKDIQLVRTSISETPEEFVRVLRKEKNWRALNYLMTYFDHQEQFKTLNLLNYESRSELLKENSQFQEMPIRQFRQWVAGFAEQLIIERVRTSDSLFSKIDKSLQSQVEAAPAKMVVGFLNSHNSPNAWTVGLELLNQDQIKSLLGSVEKSKWLEFIEKGSTLSPEEIESTVKELLDYCHKESHSDLQQEKDLNSAQEKLTTPVIHFTESLDFIEEKELFVNMKQRNKHFYQKVVSKYWPKYIVEIIPDAVIQERFKRLSPDKKFEVSLMASPETKTRFLGFIPEGPGKTVIQDRLKRAEETPPKNDVVEKAKATYRDFLSQLKESQDKEGWTFIEDDNVTPIGVHANNESSDDKAGDSNDDSDGSGSQSA